jgi:hypothetical protein
VWYADGLITCECVSRNRREDVSVSAQRARAVYPRIPQRIARARGDVDTLATFAAPLGPIAFADAAAEFTRETGKPASPAPTPERTHTATRTASRHAAPSASATSALGGVNVIKPDTLTPPWAS